MVLMRLCFLTVFFLSMSFWTRFLKNRIDGVANASRVAISIRYSLLPCWVSKPQDFTSFQESTNVKG